MINQSVAKIVLQAPPNIRKIALQMQEESGDPAAWEFIPHLTLGIMYLDFSNLERIRKILKIIAYNFSVFNCRITWRHYGELYGPGNMQSYLTLEESNKLRQVHQKTMVELLKYTVDEPLKASSFYDSCPMDDYTTNLVETYAQEHAFKQWKPTIELWDVQLEPQELDYEFFFSKIAVWKMWYHGRLTREVFFTKISKKY